MYEALSYTLDVSGIVRLRLNSRHYLMLSRKAALIVAEENVLNLTVFHSLDVLRLVCAWSFAIVTPFI